MKEPNRAESEAWTYRAVKALAVIIVWQSFNPPVASLHGETASETLGGEQFIPIRFAVRASIFQEERFVAEQFTAVWAVEAFRVEMFADGVQTISLLAATGRKEKMSTSFSIDSHWRTLIFPVHLAHAGAKNFSKQYSQ